MATKRGQANAAMAKWMKEHNVTRTTGQCPWGCGRPIQNGGEALLRHLNACHGPSRRIS